MTQILRLFALAALTALSGCGYNTLQTTDEAIKSAWSEVLNQYQRRADLVPNLVETVKAFAAQEREVLTAVTEARSRVGSIQATPELVDNPEAFQRFQAAQGELSSALSRLAGAAGRYGKPHRRGAQPLYQVRAGLQRHGAFVPNQPHRDGVRLQDEAEFHRGKRARNLNGA